MPTSQISEMIHDLRRAVLHDGAGLADGELLERFVRERDAEALSALIQRHAGMVWNVCRRGLDGQDAEDAFQATFLVLVRKAASIQRKELVAGWLHGVARQTVMRARSAAFKQRRRERQVSDMPEPAAADHALWDDIQPILDQELDALPEKYRALILLCDLQGKTRKEAAGQLDCPEGTVAGRLARARALLAKRLARRGVGVSAGLLAGLLTTHAAMATAPAAVIGSTIEAATLHAAGQATTGAISAAALALSEGVVKAMFLSKLKLTACIVALLGVFSLGTGSLVHHVLADSPVDANTTPIVAPLAGAAHDLAPTSAQERKPNIQREQGRGTVVTGKLEAVDAAKSTVTILVPMRPQGPVEKSYPLAKDVKVQRDGKDVKLADLKKGGMARLILTADGKSVATLVVDSPSIPANLKSVNADRKSITVVIGGRAERQEKTLQVAKDAKITIDRQDAALADLKEGAQINIRVDDNNQVLEIRVATARRE